RKRGLADRADHRPQYQVGRGAPGDRRRPGRMDQAQLVLCDGNFARRGVDDLRHRRRLRALCFQSAPGSLPRHHGRHGAPVAGLALHRAGLRPDPFRPAGRFRFSLTRLQQRMSWLAFALCGPVLWAISTHLDKYLVERYFKNTDVIVLLVFTALMGLVLMPIIACYEPGVFQRDWLSIGLMALSGLLYMGGITFYLRALQGHGPPMA